jgi:hypothetical protein
VIRSCDDSTSSVNVQIFHVKVVHLGVEVIGETRAGGAPVKLRAITSGLRRRSRTSSGMEAPGSVIGLSTQECALDGTPAASTGFTVRLLGAIVATVLSVTGIHTAVFSKSYG